MKKPIILIITILLIALPLASAYWSSFGDQFYRLEDNLFNSIVLDDGGNRNGTLKQEEFNQNTSAVSINGYDGLGFRLDNPSSVSNHIVIENTSFNNPSGADYTYGADYDWFGLMMWINASATQTITTYMWGIYQDDLFGSDRWGGQFFPNGSIGFNCFEDNVACSAGCNPAGIVHSINNSEFNLLTWLWDFKTDRHLLYRNDTLVINCSYTGDGHNNSWIKINHFNGNDGANATYDNILIIKNISNTRLPTSKDISDIYNDGILSTTQNINYTPEKVLETSLQTFSIDIYNLTAPLDIDAVLYYNGTAYPLTKTTYPTHTNFSTIISIPKILDLIRNNTFYFEYNNTFQKGIERITTIEYDHIVYKVIIDECINASMPTFNVSVRNKSTNDYSDVNLDYVFEYWVDDPLYLLNTSGNHIGNNQTFCIYPNWTKVTSDIFFEYNLIGNSILFDYFLFQLNLTNKSRLLTLYTQEGTTQVLFTVLDQNSDPIENAYIHILQYDIANNIYSTVEILKTDSQGQALGNIVLGTTFYSFFVYYQGSLIYTEQAVKLISTIRTFTINVVGIDWFEDFETTLGVMTNLYFNNITNNFVYTWTDPSSEMHFACLRVDEANRTGKFELNTTCVESTSGTILYNIPVLNAGSTYTGTGYLKFDFPMITDVVTKLITPSSSLFNKYPFGGLFIAFLLCVTMVMIGMPKPDVALTFLGIGVLICSLLGLWVISIMQIGSIFFLIMLQLFLKRSKQ